jgi:hypothetical protein
MMPAGTSMVPRVFKTNVGDIFTTNTIIPVKEDGTAGDISKVEVGAYLTPSKRNGILDITTEEPGTNPATMLWQIVKVYTMPDFQKGVKIMRVQ